jgi:hypothetical protein
MSCGQGSSTGMISGLASAGCEWVLDRESCCSNGDFNRHRRCWGAVLHFVLLLLTMLLLLLLLKPKLLQKQHISKL